MSVEKQNFISRAYSRVFVGLFLDWVSNGMKAKDLDCFSDACILVEGGIGESLENIKKMILKQNRIGREGRVKNKASFFTRPFCVTGSFGEFPATQKALTCR